MTKIMGDTTTQKKRERDDSDEFELVSPEVKRLRDDLLSFLDDSDHSTATPDLDLFMQSFQQEISASPVVVVDLTEEQPGESQLDLGYLLEASDDELGLPPPPTCEDKPDDITIVGGEMWRFEEQITSYDEFGIVCEGSSYSTGGGEYVALEGLFDYSDAGFCTNCTVDEPTEFLWRQEILPSL